jgi:hypothetical protein
MDVQSVVVCRIFIQYVTLRNVYEAARSAVLLVAIDV